VELGGQNFYPEKEGAFTGEVSPTMLQDAGCKYAIVGHSERRHLLCETDAFINRKVLLGLRLGLHIILCVGETLQEREAGRTNADNAARLMSEPDVDGALVGGASLKADDFLAIIQAAVG